ncbi:hypothetical protein RHMOL_Rhmol01G0320100 [Rhododendron molle]|uniref:Uncharacterized protein n=1 Tax=Rhododendron molle TaxID=49168 RepID=A0ACC0Q8B0_RHOML|nr:hypothetical protein RHMOL_Rhmol01G0320100 [Rhododendron molle]
MDVDDDNSVSTSVMEPSATVIDGSGPPRSTVEYEVSEQSRQTRERQENAMQELLIKRRAAALAVPTIDMAVRARLSCLGEPITLIGGREMERRDRLRMLKLALLRPE